MKLARNMLQRDGTWDGVVFFFYCEKNERRSATSHTLRSLSGRLQQIRWVRCDPLSAIQGRPGGDERRCEGASARNCKHTGPPPPPSQKRGSLQQWLYFPAARCRHVRHEVQSFIAPSSARLDGHNNEIAPSPINQLSVFSLLVSAGLLQDSTIYSSGVGARSAVRSECCGV